MKTKYNKRTWLNEWKSDSTASAVGFDGEVTDIDTQKQYKHKFFEIADCRHKVRLHQTSDDTDEDFINKLKTLKNSVEVFIDHLEKEKEESK